VTTGELADVSGGFGGVIVRLDADRAIIAAANPARLEPDAVGVRAQDLCYVI